MCGINGFYQFESLKSPEDLRNMVHKMNNEIIHRGPDAEGNFSDQTAAIGMRRLAIIDLKTGNQPIWNKNKSKCIVFNGMIYNYREIKKELIAADYKFYTNSDTEVILLAYEKYGIDCLTMFEGMFAFAIYDLENKELFLARDRIGEKPLYFYQSEKEFIFGSELKSLIATGRIKKEINMKALTQYFQLTYIPAPLTIYKDVYKLPPASWMVLYPDGTKKSGTYWDISYQRESLIGDYETCKKLVREAVFKSVERRLVSDVPFGAFLSGGIDSTIIAGAMAQISSNPINTFTIGFREKAYDESNLAGITAKKIGSNHHILKLEWDNAAENIEYVLSNMDEPFADSSLIATYTVSKMAREYVKVVLTGDSGDELFAGYNKYLISYYSDIYNRFPGFIRNGIIRPISDILPSDWSLTRKVKKVVQSSGKDIFMQRREMMCLGLKDDEIGCLSPQFDGIDATYDLICSYYDRLEDAEEITRAQYVDLKVLLEGDMLPKVDRASMLASLETRVPYIDSDLINIAYQIPSEYKIKGKRRKIILKDAFSDIIPEELLNAPKKGFSVPMAHWLRTILKRKLLSYASSSYMEDQGLFQAEFVNRLINEHMSKKRDRTSELWSFFVFQNWYDRNMA